MASFSRNINVTMDWLDKASFEIRGSLNDNVHSVAATLVLGYPDFTIREATGEITLHGGEAKARCGSHDEKGRRRPAAKARYGVALDAPASQLMLSV
ncbi:MAG: hypothetical protein WAU45_00685 [Blastocatellia bacterium]